MKSKKTRQMQLQKMRELLLDKESPALSEGLEQTEYSSLHGQSQPLEDEEKQVEESVTKPVKPLQLFTKKRKKAMEMELKPQVDDDVSSQSNNLGDEAEDDELSEEPLSDDDFESMEEESSSDDEAEFQEAPSPLKVKVTTIPDTDFEVRVLEDESDEQNLLFSSLKKYGVNKQTLKRLKDVGFFEMTDFQAKTIPALLEGRDVVSKLTPGCGKVLAYLIPALEILIKLDFKRQHGTGIIILVPTPELIRDVYDFIKLILKAHNFNCCNLMSGNAREHETENLRQGANFLVCTPGHLLYHMHNAPVFKYANVQYLVIDEADRIADLGLHFELSQILDLLPKRRQTLLFSRNINQKTVELASYCLKKRPFFVDSAQNETASAVTDGPELQCLLCPTENRFSFLYTFLRSKLKKKVVVLFSSCLSVQYHYDILNYLNMSCLCIHGKQGHLKKKETCSEFAGLANGILLCTNAAAVDLEISKFDWVMQYDPPDDITEFLKRRGKVVGDVAPSTEALVLLRPEEKGFFSHLRKANVPLKELKLPEANLLKIENEVEPAVKSMYFLHKSSRDGYMAFVKAYAAHQMTQVFDVKTLDLVKVARSFGFAVPPFIDFDVHCRQVGKIFKRKSDEKEKIVYAAKKSKKSKRSKHMRFEVPKTD